MDVRLEDLVPLALLEEQEAAVIDKVRNAEQRLERQRQATARLAAALAAQDARLDQLKAEDRALQDELRKAVSLQTSAQRALDQGLGNAKAVEHQLATCAATIDDTETRILELLVARDETTAARAKAAEEAAAAARDLSDLEAKTLPALASWKTEATRLEGERRSLRAHLPRDVAGTYDMVHARKGSALARIVDKTCAACARSVPSQRLLDVRAGRLVACDGCSRWLWIAADGK